MDGLLNLDKPTGITSAKALYRVRSLVGQRKSGHAGTLDPAAAGVLLLLLGKGTKLTERLMDQPKTYRATARLDVTSASFDSDSPLQPVSVQTVPALADLRAALAGLEGDVLQIPPMVSALKVGGQPAYKLARRGQTVELKARPARIHWLHVHSYAWPDLDFEMACGRGVYVRAIIRDVGLALGVGGCLTSLIRTAVGPFARDDGYSLASLAEMADPARAVLPLDDVLERLAMPLAIPPRPGGT